jgi:hypothetical protein
MNNDIPRKPPPEKRKGVYRKIVQGVQGNPFGPTVKSLRGYRRIA